MYAPSFGYSVISSGDLFEGIKSNSSLSIGTPMFFLLNLCKRDVVKPVGYVNAPIQKVSGIPFVVQSLKNSYLYLKSSNQLARGFSEKYANDQASGILLSFNEVRIFSKSGEIATKP
jgi:hypothetical protein